MILMIDNYDSFTYNLVQYIGELDYNVVVARNDAITVEKIKHLKPSKIIISPGPCSPDQAGISLDIVNYFHQTIPILGVCLGHQTIAQAFGTKIVHARNVMHGKTSLIHHKQNGLFKNIPSPYTVMRYHSLVAQEESLADCFEITAWTDWVRAHNLLGPSSVVKKRKSLIRLIDSLLEDFEILTFDSEDLDLIYDSKLNIKIPADRIELEILLGCNT